MVLPYLKDLTLSASDFTLNLMFEFEFTLTPGGHPVSPGHYETKWEIHKIPFYTITTLDHLHLVHPRLSVLSRYGIRTTLFLCNGDFTFLVDYDNGWRGMISTPPLLYCFSFRWYLTDVPLQIALL